MYMPANSAFFSHDSWKSYAPNEAAAPLALEPDDDVDVFESLLHAARSGLPSKATPAAPNAPRRMNVRRSSSVTESSWLPSTSC